jgi:hypothetical protein
MLWRSPPPSRRSEDWLKAGVARDTPQHLMIRNLIERDQGTNDYRLTPQGLAVVSAMLLN